MGRPDSRRNASKAAAECFGPVVDRRAPPMFWEIGPGMYMRIATAAESRAEERDVYRPPPSELSMAHRSYLSPDRQSVLVAEMTRTGGCPVA